MPQGNPRACVPSAYAPKSAAFCAHFGTEKPFIFCVFLLVPKPSFGRGSFCTGSGGFSDPRTDSSCHETESHGQRPWLWFFVPRSGRSSRTAAALTAQVSGRFSRSACCTSCDTPRSRAWQLSSACVPGNTPRSSACSIPASCMVLAASSLSGSPPGKTKNAQATTTLTGIYHGSGAGHFGRWHGLSNIHNRFLPAQFALARQVSDGCVRQDLQQLSLAALRANCPSVLHKYFTTNAQQFQLLLLGNERRYTYPQDRKE